MKRRKRFLVIGIILLINFIHFSCKPSAPDDPANPPAPPVPYTPVMVTASIKGRVISKNAPLAQAKVEVGNKVVYTDGNGEFRIDNVTTEKYSTFIKASGLLMTGGRTIIINENALNYVEISLQYSTYQDQVTADPIDIVGNDGSKVSMPPDALINLTTNRSPVATYVSCLYNSPLDSSFLNVLPGNLRGITLANEERGLTIFSIVSASLNAQTSGVVQLRAGKKMTFSFPVATAIAANAPATIPLWYFNDTTGFWKEEGVAIKQGNKYVAETNRFTSWACATSYPLIKCKINAVDQNKIPIGGSKVYFKDIDNTFFNYEISDSSGQINCLLPLNKAIELKLASKCGTELFSKMIGPFQQDAEIKEMQMTLNYPVSVIISGTATNCDGQPIKKGSVYTFIDGRYLSTDFTNGQYQIPINRCTSSSTEVTFTIIDSISLQEASKAVANVSSGTYPVGNTVVCPNQEYITAYMSNVMKIVLPKDSISVIRDVIQHRTDLHGFLNNGGVSFTTIEINTDSATGALPLNYAFFTNYASFTNQTFVSGSAYINLYGPVGGFVSGNVSGLIDTKTFRGVIPFTCGFRYKRKI